METRYTIGQLARAAGVPTSTIRYYERAGLLEASARSEGNYRLYGEGAREQLRFIRAAQATGFTLEDIKVLLDHHHGEPGVCRDVQGLIRDRLAEVKRRLDDLGHIREVLEAALARCVETEQTGHCEVIDALTAVPGPSPKKTARRTGRKAP
ncbi:MerR family transcriptional regulator [Tautonia sociabilis]|uniref:MerR family transcriptional regulator n=1 Tax=Tautonia sociabilis TaxID=2080755 RepID=A0A432MF75_9BACT|nr:MerR family transcriptional regulator [Tautonia sociabilis]RUL84392.1 MerR family transcriptional regulator [Tautonia sociabilis]